MALDFQRLGQPSPRQPSLRQPTLCQGLALFEEVFARRRELLRLFDPDRVFYRSAAPWVIREIGPRTSELKQEGRRRIGGRS